VTGARLRVDREERTVRATNKLGGGRKVGHSFYKGSSSSVLLNRTLKGTNAWRKCKYYHCTSVHNSRLVCCEQVWRFDIFWVIVNYSKLFEQKRFVHESNINRHF
jgi:hypothetical protein